ncbi:hypothetical protein [Flavobacterium psychrotrophum]|uniref:hypothetical protein n=1 Tax=Flavobacterium psychrotrophum TaxID=2294119 RepID=UPI0013C519C0|nr:hypothetical protein [Flavobacterium psychrotrophum]
MRLSKWYIGHRVLWMLMALHILNFSIDNPHTLFEHNVVDSDFDEIDSIAELVLEDVMHIEDAIPENHSKTPINNKFSGKKMIWVFEEYQKLIPQKPLPEVNFKLVLEATFYKTPSYTSPKLALFSPPPEV